MILNKLGRLLPSSWVRGLAEKVFVGVIQAIAAGKYGDAAKGTYWWAKGKKTWTGVALGLAGALAYVLQWPPAVAAGLSTLASLLLAAGLADKVLHSDFALGGESWYRWLVSRGHDIAWGLTLAAGWVYGAECHALTIHGHLLTCATMQAGLLGIVGALVYLGVLDVASLSAAPIPPDDVARLKRIRSGDYSAFTFVAILALTLVGCGSLAQVRVGGEAKPAGPDQKVVEGLVCQAREPEAAVYIADRGGSRAEITERIERARLDTAGKPGCACREARCVSLKE